MEAKGSFARLAQLCTFQVLYFQWVVGKTTIIKKHSISSYLNIFSILKAPRITFPQLPLGSQVWKVLSRFQDKFPSHSPETYKAGPVN